MNRRILTITVVVVALGVFGAAVALRASSSNEQPPTAMTRPRTNADALPAAASAAAAQRGLSVAASRRIADGTYLVPSNSGGLCLVSLTFDEMRTACNGQGSFFGGKQLVYTIAEQGSPGALTGLTVSGIARPAVAEIQVTFAGGVVETTTPTSDGGFELSAAPSALAGGEPSAIAAVNSGGQTIETDPGPTAS